MEDKRLATESVLLAEVPAVIELPEERPMKQKVVIAAVLVAIGLISLLVIAAIASSPATYSDMNSTLDEKRSNVMALVATTTAASAAVSALPGDTGTPIAEKLVDFSFYFMVILAVLYLEKFLLTTLGFLGFGILVPVACALFAGSVFARRGSMAKANLQSLGAKFAAFGVAIALVIPASVWLTDSIDNSFDESLAAANVAAQEATTQLEESVQDEGGSEGNFLDDLFGAVQQGVEQLTQGAQEALDSLGRQLNTIDRHAGGDGGNFLLGAVAGAGGVPAAGENGRGAGFRRRHRGHGNGAHARAIGDFVVEASGVEGVE